MVRPVACCEAGLAGEAEEWVNSVFSRYINGKYLR